MVTRLRLPRRDELRASGMSAMRPVRVAILGGGCAALTTASELSHPKHHGRYAVTVYQLGWRLGGKGASGRGPEGRIEEHGLHLWMGFYENAFRLMRETYAEADRDPLSCPLATWRDAFVPAPDVGVAERGRHGDWQHWIAHFPPGQGEPGDPLTDRNPFTVRGYLVQAAGLLTELLRSAAVPTQDATREGVPPVPPRGPAAVTSEQVTAAVDRVLKLGQFAATAALFEAADILRGALAAVSPPAYRGPGVATGLLALIDALAGAARRQVHALTNADEGLRRVWEVADIILAILRGSVRFGLAVDPRGFDAIDDYDWREWLGLCGASEASLDSGFIRGIYDLAFAFEDGDVTRPRLAAGVALRGAMRMFFTYRGALFYRMGAGMGDAVFAPLYEVLRKRGVRFEFFHRLTHVGLCDPARVPPGERAWVERLDFDLQADVPAGEYHPLTVVRGIPSWPAGPDWSQLRDGDALRAEGRAFEAFCDRRSTGTKTLYVGEHFDQVVLGVSVGALPHVAGDLLARESRWRDMAARVKTVATQAAQVWLREPVEALGWDGPPANLSGFVEPFDTWADMRHLIPAEDWEVPPRAIAYFCSVLPDADGWRAVPGPDAAGTARAYALVRANAVRFLDRDIRALWPRAVHPTGGFRWEILAVPTVATDATGGARGTEPVEATGEARFDTQFWAANVNPSDRYVLSLPGASRYRLSPLEVTFDNLTVAGDWTASGLNSGCVESAVMSGLLAAHAVSHSPPLEDILGYDHP